jgi:AraC-like DNA-binding protein
MTGYRNISRALAYIEANLREPISLTEISKESGMSKYYFARTFKTFTGKTFKAYHNEKRIEAAKLMLQKPDARVTDVCFAVGFNDISYFCRLFHRFTGMSPSSYRKKYRSPPWVMSEPTNKEVDK